MEEPKHEKHVEYRRLDDGAVEITSKSYFERLAHMLVEIEAKKESDFKSLKTDVETMLKHITDDGSPKLVLTIERKDGKFKLTKRYITIKQDFNRR